MLGEFELINKYFKFATSQREDVSLGIGDDCALLDVPCDQQLAITADTLVSGVHFSKNTNPQSIGYKALAVNLSDLAAMGATPAWATLCITIPEINTTWLSEFMRGFSDLASKFKVQLIGGDTTQGPLSISIQLHGFVPKEKALKRDKASIGDSVFVSGTLGDAGLALLKNHKINFPDSSLLYLKDRLDRPTPRVELGVALRSYDASAIDISDGLYADLNHLCDKTEKGMTINLNQIPLSNEVKSYVEKTYDWSVPLSSGDDYELAFTIPAKLRSKFLEESEDLDVLITEIGNVDQEPGIKIIDSNGNILSNLAGYEHFK